MNSDPLYVFSVMALLNITGQATYAAKERGKKKKAHTEPKRLPNTNAPHDQCNVLN